MDYEMKYKNALEWARQVMNGETGFIRREVEEVFPELKESEDERIRKEIIDFILDNETNEGDDINRWLTWLEKQGKKKDINPTLIEKEKMDDAFTKMMFKGQVDGFDAELNALLKKYEHLSKKELQESLEFYLDAVRENPNYHVGWINIYKHEYGYTLSREMCNTCEEARKYRNKNTVATIKIEWEEQQ